MGPCVVIREIWYEASESLEPAAKVVGGDEVAEVLPELVVAVVVIPFDGRFLDRPIHPFRLTVGPEMPHSGQAMLDAILVAECIW